MPTEYKGKKAEKKQRRPKRTTLDRLKASQEVAERKRGRATRKLIELKAKVVEAEREVDNAANEVIAFDSAIERLQENDAPVVE